MKRVHVRRLGVNLLVAALATGSQLLVAAPAAAYTYETTHTAMSGQPSAMGQTNGPVWAVEAAKGRIYAGGDFTSTRPAGAAAGTGETGQAYLAAFDGATGAPIPDFAPRLTNDWTNGPGSVYASAVSPDGATLYVGGDFNRIDGVRAEHVAAFDAATGAFKGQVGWNGVNNDVRAMAVSPDGKTLYVGGSFSKANWDARSYLAAFDVASGRLTSWSPQISVPVQNQPLGITSLAVSTDGSTVFVGGTFTKVNGQSMQGFAATDPINGTLKPGFRSNYLYAPTSWATTIETAGPDVFFGGRDDLTSSGSRTEGVYSVSSTTGAVNWYARCYGDTFAVLPVGDEVYVGSHAHDCAPIGGHPEKSPRTYLAMHALNRATGKLRPYFVESNGNQTDKPSLLMSRALASDGKQLVMAGGYHGVNGKPQANISRFLPGSAAPSRGGWPSVTTCSGCNTATIRVLEGYDRDDVNLTYRVFRFDHSTNPVAERVSESVMWEHGTFDVTDSGLKAGQRIYYKVQTLDPAGNVVWSVRSNTVTVGQP